MSFPHLTYPFDNQWPCPAELSPTMRSECCAELGSLEHVSLGGFCPGLTWVLDFVALAQGRATRLLTIPLMGDSFDSDAWRPHPAVLAHAEGLAGCIQPEPAVCSFWGR